MSEKRRLISNTLANGAAQFIAMASSLVFMPLLIREFGNNDYGLFMLATAIAAYASIVDFGVGTALIKNVAERDALNDTEGVGKYVSTALVFYIAIGVLVAIVIAGFALVSGSVFKVDADSAVLLRNLLLVVAVSSIWTWPGSTANYVLAGFQRYTLTATTAMFIATGNIIVILVVLATNQGPVALLAGQSFVALLGIVLNGLFANRTMGNVRIHPRLADAAIFRDILSFSWVIFVLQLCTVVIYQQTDRVVLGIFLGASAITLYESSGKMQGLVTQITGFAASAVMPFATQLAAEGRASSVQTLFFRGTKYVMALVLPIVLALMILARPVIVNWLGPGFASQALAARILLSYQLLGAGAVVGEHILASRGHAHRRLFNSIFVVTLGNLVLSIVLVQRIGVLGVVIGTAVPWIVDFPWRLRTALTEVEVPFREWFTRAAGPVYLSLCATAAVALLSYLTPLVHSLVGVGVALMMSVVASWAWLFAFNLSPVEKSEVKALMARATALVRQS